MRPRAWMKLQIVILSTAMWFPARLAAPAPAQPKLADRNTTQAEILRGKGKTVPHEAEPERARKAVLKALPLLQASARTWFEMRECASCHHQGLGMMAVAAARERGFAIDEAMLAEQVEKTRSGLVAYAKYILGNPSTNEQIGQSYRLVGLAAGGLQPNEGTALAVHMLAGKQHVSGHWSSYSHRPPLEDSNFTATAMTIRALRLYKPPSRELEMNARILRATAWLAEAKPRFMEEQAMQLFGLAWGGAASRDIARARRELLREQRPDGGWAQIPTRGSDAYATGQALVALNQAGGFPVNNPAYKRGVEFLLRTQESEGSWLVETRRTWKPGLQYFESGFPYGRNQFISYAGTAWATMALALSGKQEISTVLMKIPTDPSTAASARAGAPEGNAGSASGGLSPLMRAALWGTHQDMEQQIREGADVNAPTTSLGITPLMCAVHDPAKAALLVKAGANVNAATKSQHTALMIASGYDGALETVKLLLENGAQVNRRASDLDTALIRAVGRGDSDTISQLLAHGTVLNDLEHGSGALVFASLQNDPVTAAMLLDRGALADSRLPSRLFATKDATPLMLSAEIGDFETVKLLLSRGAVVNAQDAEGFTPLMYAAATFDRGNTEIIGALLTAGADVQLRTPAGDTALSLAERYGNTHAADIIKAAALKKSGG